MNDKITGQKIEKIVRQSNGYYIYLMNGTPILAIKTSGRNLFCPPKYTNAPMEYIEAKSLPKAIDKYIEKYNLIQ